MKKLKLKKRLDQCQVGLAAEPIDELEEVYVIVKDDQLGYSVLN